ncbi:hypothetical protein ACLIX5_004457 [Salmonella enterica subsp. enterica serovar Bredeney]
MSDFISGVMKSQLKEATEQAKEVLEATKNRGRDSVISDLQSLVYRLAKRVEILEAVAVAEAPESLKAVQTIYQAAQAVTEAE